MRQFIIILKSSFKKKSSYLSLIIYLIGNLLNYFWIQKHSILNAALCVRIYFALIPIVLFFPVNNFLNIVKYRKEEGFHRSKTFTTKQIKLAAIGIVFNYIILLVGLPVGILAQEVINLLKNLKSNKELCEENFKKQGILVANFSQDVGEIDGFTNSLYGRLNSDLQNVDTLSVLELRRFITETNRSYLDTIKDTFHE